MLTELVFSKNFLTSNSKIGLDTFRLNNCEAKLSDPLLCLLLYLSLLKFNLCLLVLRNGFDKKLLDVLESSGLPAQWTIWTDTNNWASDAIIMKGVWTVSKSGHCLYVECVKTDGAETNWSRIRTTACSHPINQLFFQNVKLSIKIYWKDANLMVSVTWQYKKAFIFQYYKYYNL